MSVDQKDFIVEVVECNVDCIKKLTDLIVKINSRIEVLEDKIKQYEKWRFENGTLNKTI